MCALCCLCAPNTTGWLDSSTCPYWVSGWTSSCLIPRQSTASANPNDMAALGPVLLLFLGLLAIKHLGHVMLGAALTPGSPASAWAQRFADGCGASLGWLATGLMGSMGFVGRWVVGPAFKRIRNKPSLGRVSLCAAMFCCVAWLTLRQVSQMVHMSMQALPGLPYPALMLTMGLDVLYMAYLGLMAFYVLGWGCLLAALLE